MASASLARRGQGTSSSHAGLAPLVKLLSVHCHAPWLASDHPDRASLQRALGLPSGSRSCAVVGSSDLLRHGPPRGEDIDRHDLVWRLNNAPTATFERLVGARTSVRVINHVPVRKWNLLAADRAALLRTVDGHEYEALLCAPARSAPNASLEHSCVVSAQGAGGSQSLAATVATYRARHASHRLVPLDATVQRLGARCSTSLGGTAPSGGLLTVLLALLACDGPVSLYGFWPFCCHAHRGLPRMNYKYSQGNRTAWVCCSRGRERMEVKRADGTSSFACRARSCLLLVTLLAACCPLPASCLSATLLLSITQSSSRDTSFPFRRPVALP